MIQFRQSVGNPLRIAVCLLVGFSGAGVTSPGAAMVGGAADRGTVAGKAGLALGRQPISVL